MKRIQDLVDFTGFRDRRYALFAAGSFLVNLGLYSPYFYLGGSPIGCREELIAEFTGQNHLRKRTVFRTTSTLTYSPS